MVVVQLAGAFASLSTSSKAAIHSLCVMTFAFGLHNAKSRFNKQRKLDAPSASSITQEHRFGDGRPRQEFLRWSDFSPWGCDRRLSLV